MGITATTLVSGPGAEPVTLAEVKEHLRIDDTDSDDVLTGLIKTAREYVEKITRRALISQTWDMFLDEWPDEKYIEVRYPPLQSVTSVTYTDSGGTVNTLSTEKYEVDTDSEPGRVTLKYGKSWPSDTLWPNNPIKVRYVAGYGSSGSDVPQAILTAIKMLVAHRFENREIVVVGQAVDEVPVTASRGTESLGYEAIEINHTGQLRR